MQRFSYLLLNLAGGFYPAIRRRCTRAGVLALAVLLLAAVVGIDTELTLAYQIFALVFVLTVVAAIGAWRFHGPFSVRRSLPLFATAGEPISYRIEIRNDSDRVQPSLLVMEELADPRPTFETFAALPPVRTSVDLPRRWPATIRSRRRGHWQR